jgi:carbon-monoxide dehydrogenase medium subunit
MDAAASLRSVRGARTVPMDAFFVGPRQTAIGQDEVLVGITVPAMAPGSRGVYLKHAPRRSMDLAIVGVAALVTCENGVCKDVKIALGAVGPTPFRAKRAEEVIRGGRVSDDVIEEAARVASTECRPIGDHRASAEYRCDMVYVLTRRALTQVLAQ